MSGKFLARASVLSLAVFLAACGGDDNSTPLAKTAKNSGEKTSEKVDINAELRPSPGHYQTTIRISGNDKSVSGYTLLSGSGNFVTITEEYDSTFGEIAFVDEADVAGTGQNFLPNGSPAAQGTIFGTVFSKSSLQLNISAPDYTSAVSLKRSDALSDAGIDKSTLRGVYFMSSLTSTDQLSITINDDLSLTGNYGSSCALTGDLIIPSTAYNVFEATYTATNCKIDDPTPNGTFAGLGYLNDGKLMFLATDDTTVTYFIES